MVYYMAEERVRTHVEKGNGYKQSVLPAWEGFTWM